MSPTSDSTTPEKLRQLVENLSLLDARSDRIEMLISLADGYREVSPEVATRPWDQDHRVKACESEVYVWVTDRPNGTLGLHFAVDNPQGISAMALAAILTRTLDGAPPAAIGQVPDDVVYDIFGRELSMGKSMGLIEIVQTIKAEAKKRLN